VFEREVESFKDSSASFVERVAERIGGINPAMTLRTHQPAG
jgi:hypothetical protein